MTLDLPRSGFLLPADGTRPSRPVLRKARLLALRSLLTAGDRVADPALARALHRLRPVLETVARRHTDRLFDALGSPDVLGPLLVGARMPDRCDEGVRTAVPSLLALLAGTAPGFPVKPAMPPPPAESVWTEAVFWDVPATVVVHEAAGWGARFMPPAAAMVAGPTGLEVEWSSRRGPLPGPGMPAGHVLLPVHPRVPGLCLSLVDTNPLAMVEDHPDKQGNAFDLGGHTTDQWTAALAAALDLVELALPAWFGDLPGLLRRIVPVGFQPQVHLSASYREVPGLVYLSLHPSPLTLAEALVHEVQHSRLNALMLLGTVLENGATAWTPSPVRPDLRPLDGVLLAVHAFTPVAALHARLEALDHPLSRTPEFRRRRDQVLSGNARGLALLDAHAAPSASLGGPVLRALHALHAATLDAAGSVALDPQGLPPG